MPRKMETALYLHKALWYLDLQRKQTRSLRRIKDSQTILWFGFSLFHHTLVPAACSVKVIPSSLITLPIFTGDSPFAQILSILYQMPPFYNQSSVPPHPLPQPESAASVGDADTHLCEPPLASSCNSCDQKATSKPHLCGTGGDWCVPRSTLTLGHPYTVAVGAREAMYCPSTTLLSLPCGFQFVWEMTGSVFALREIPALIRGPQFYRAYSKRN